MSNTLEVYEAIPPSAMVIVAHPDDAEFMCAGTVARWARGGSEVTYVLVTSGDKGFERSHDDRRVARGHARP